MTVKYHLIQFDCTKYGRDNAIEALKDGKAKSVKHEPGEFESFRIPAAGTEDHCIHDANGADAAYRRRPERFCRSLRSSAEVSGHIQALQKGENRSMIFCFTGTGNSFQAAKALCMEGEEPLDLANCLREGRGAFDLAKGEALGIVCPVYYGGVPSTVLDFVRSLQVSPSPEYCYVLLTCASSVSGAAGQLAEALSAKGIALHAAYSVIMPENDVIHYTISPEEERDAILADAAEALRVIANCVAERRKLGLHIPPRGRMITCSAYPCYEQDRETKHFHVDDQCVGCGKCVERCPEDAMVMENGQPKWVKDKCALCMACIRCGAIHYDEATKGKKRYVNPILKSCH